MDNRCFWERVLADFEPHNRFVRCLCFCHPIRSCRAATALELCLFHAQWFDADGTPVVLFDKTKSSNTLPIVYYNCYNDDCHIVGLMNTSFNPVTKRRNPMVFEGPFVCGGWGVSPPQNPIIVPRVEVFIGPQHSFDVASMETSLLCRAVLSIKFLN
jgi:hypothetical protein